MKIKLVSVAILSLIACSSQMALAANQAIFKNGSDKLIKVTYKLAHKNANSAPVFGPETTIDLATQTVIPVELGNYEFAGAVPVAVDGRRLPEHITQFNPDNKKCVAITNKQKTTDTLVMAYKEEGGHGSITCSWLQF